MWKWSINKFIAAGIVGMGINLGLQQAQAHNWCATPEVRKAALLQRAKAAAGWKFAGKYGSYKAACKRAACLEEQGYETCIEQEGNGWCVYCR